MSTDELASLLSADPGVAQEIEEAPKEAKEISPGEIEALVAEYRDVRADLADRRHAYQEYEERAKTRMDQISMRLREISEALGLESLVTKVGTAYKTTVRHYRVSNFDQVIEYCKETGNFHIIEKRVAKLATQEIHEKTGQVPPGIDYSAEIEFRIMKNSRS